MTAFRSLIWVLFLLLTVALAVSPFAVILAPAILGGLVVAVVLMWRRPRAVRQPPARDVFGADAASTDVINLSHVKVAGWSGLGFVAVALVTALTMPPIGVALAIAAIGGALIAFGTIVWRRV